jgi:hypothetical protein
MLEGGERCASILEIDFHITDPSNNATLPPLAPIATLFVAGEFRADETLLTILPPALQWGATTVSLVPSMDQ